MGPIGTMGHSPVVNSRLSQLQPYPFEKLRALLAGLTPAGRPIPLSIGEPQHATPELLRRAITDHLDGLSSYPATAGHDRVRTAIAAWFERRYNLKPSTRVRRCCRSTAHAKRCLPSVRR